MKDLSTLESRLTAAIKTRLWQASGGLLHIRPFPELVGCSYAEFIKHLSNTIPAGFDWTNYGDALQIDHISPLYVFGVFDNPEDAKTVFHYSNLRLITAYRNQTRPKACVDHKRPMTITGLPLFNQLESPVNIHAGY